VENIKVLKKQQIVRESDLEVETVKVMDNFDLDATMIKLNDGMSNVPSGEPVEDPTINVDGDNPTLPEGLTAPAYSAITNIKDMIIAKKDGDAQRLYDKMKSYGMFSDLDGKCLIEFDTISATVKDIAE